MSMYQADRLILICNDDGIFSKGIRALAELASEFGEVAIVAPDRQQSAVGHSITILNPLRATKFRLDDRFSGLAVNGTPADCVKLAHDKLLPRKPDLVLSGINHGSNAGINIMYSGTVSAATEATILGYPAIAVSCADFDEDADLSGSIEAARRAVSYVLTHGLPAGVTLNVNAPGGAYRGLKLTQMAHGRYVDEFVEREHPNRTPYYWITGRLEVFDQGEDFDIQALKSGYATITPIQYDLTAYPMLKFMADRMGDIQNGIPLE